MWLWRAFNRLSTTRPHGFSQGPISYREARLYADEMGLGEDQGEFLWDVVSKVDARYLQLIAERTKVEAGRNTPPRRR